MEVEAVLVHTRRDPATDPRPWDGRSSLKVVGESYRQDALEQVTGRRNQEALKLEDVPMELVCEPENAHDHLAVRVEIDGQLVGYLPRGNARYYHRRIQREGGRVSLRGFVGAREGEPIGVRVHVPHEHPIQVPLKKRRTSATTR